MWAAENMRKQAGKKKIFQKNDSYNSYCNKKGIFRDLLFKGSYVRSAAFSFQKVFILDFGAFVDCGRLYEEF